MSELAVLVPSRGRPQQAAELVDAWFATRSGAALWLALDYDDPTRADYPFYGEQGSCEDSPEFLSYVTGPSKGGIGPILNGLGPTLAKDYAYVGFMGDDHRPRTHGWGVKVTDALSRWGTGMVYGDDLFQGPALPTAVFMRSSIILALGRMVPLAQRHLFLDDYWKALGAGAGCLAYLPDVIIEHLHPHAGKAEVDEGYERVWPLWEADERAWNRFRTSGQLDWDIGQVRSLIHGVTV